MAAEVRPRTPSKTPGAISKQPFLAHQTFRDADYLNGAIRPAAVNLNKERRAKMC
jgi:hypothetical protein